MQTLFIFSCAQEAQEQNASASYYVLHAIQNCQGKPSNVSIFPLQWFLKAEKFWGTDVFVVSVFSHLCFSQCALPGLAQQFYPQASKRGLGCTIFARLLPYFLLKMVFRKMSSLPQQLFPILSEQLTVQQFDLPFLEIIQPVQQSLFYIKQFQPYAPICTALVLVLLIKIYIWCC